MHEKTKTFAELENFQANTTVFQTNINSTLRNLEPQVGQLALTDSCHSRVIWNQQNLFPIFLQFSVKLLQYSGLGSNTGMCFLREMRSVVELKMVFIFGFWVLFKNSGLDGCKLGI